VQAAANRGRTLCPRPRSRPVQIGSLRLRQCTARRQCCQGASDERLGILSLHACIATRYASATMKARRAALLAAGLLAVSGDTVAATPNQATATIRFENWVERSPNGYGWRPMTFRIHSVTATRRGWSIRAVVRNRTRQVIRIRSEARNPYALGRSTDFGIAEPGPTCDPQPYEPPCRYVERRATIFRPRAFGRSLRPGESWTGTFGGYGSLRRGVSYYVWFGVFVPERGAPFSWLTQRAFRLR
jgi:hypothetical protein